MIDIDALDIESELRAEIVRLNKVVEALMNRVEHSATQHYSDFDQFQTTIMLENLVRARTKELDAALRENEKINRALQEAEEKFHRVLDQSLVGITMIIEDRFHYVNPKFAAIFDYPVDELMTMDIMELVSDADEPTVRAAMQKALNQELAKINFVANAVRRNGQMITVEVSVSPAIDIGGKPALIAVLADISERLRSERQVQALHEQLQYQAIHDPLTGLYNRLFLNENLERELLLAERQGYEVSVVMSDLDHFKMINDCYGHQAGDAVLKAFADILKRHARASDLDCRYGGEEFFLVLPDTSLQTASERAESIRLALIAQPIVVAEISIHVTASFGVATYPANGLSPVALIGAADKALYLAKDAGRNQVVAAAPPLS
ncbi:sensor domain-containing diguanylate cyclase [Methylomonas sp. LW13]|uniref:GGDEF domain-containing protein n=1 Tax=unclassified Methylomonas TaxID=2608980 RepID=UPI00069208C8|nr:sensor domain-containing diguanylate cyclase [Methylomonas sp. LW13]QBC26858.1 sensor domain-containing diguanylate cyclase [Methylomonas sp. LW13]